MGNFLFMAAIILGPMIVGIWLGSIWTASRAVGNMVLRMRNWWRNLRKRDPVNRRIEPTL